MAADGSIVIDTRINTAGFGKGATNLKAQFGSLGSSVKKLGGMIATAFSVTALVNFGKQAIELGSDLQEVQNVVNVTFTTMNEQVNKFAKNAAKTAGLSETMAKRYVGTFGAMANAFQFTEGEAYDMATSLTQLAGDVASFYNITQDEAYTKLKSVFTGETESLKDLGVVMTQTALDDFALRKGLKKTISQMTEQEKVALRYQFVLEQLSAASGDFSRTSDSWANQTRILSLQFDQLKATLGQALINVLTPAMKLLNELIARVQVLADSFLEFTNAVFGNAGSASAQLKGASESADLLADNIKTAKENINEAKRALAGFDEITRISTESQESELESVGVHIEYDQNGTEKANEQFSKLGDLLSIIQGKLEPLSKIDFKKLQKSLKGLRDALKPLGENLLTKIEWLYDDILVPLSEWMIEDAGPASIDMLSSAFNLLGEIIQPVFDGIEIFFEKCKPVFEWIKTSAVDALVLWRDNFSQLAEALKQKAPEIEKIYSDMAEILRVAWSNIEPILTALKDVSEEVFRNLSGVASEALQDVVEITADFVGILRSIFEGDWAKCWDYAEEVIFGFVNGIVDLLNGLIKIVCDAINTIGTILGNINISIPDWDIFGDYAGSSWTIGIPQITAPKIPYLAQGAVIPPNAPFAAILGDQRHGTNIEAPLSTIQEAVAIVMEDMIKSNIAGHEATVAVLKEILEAILGIEIGDDTIGQAVARYNAKMAIIRGGNA